MSRRRPSRIHGLLPVFKKAGPTSHDVVDMARKALGERRIGHTGTLDPMAEGLLLLCVGQATRLQQFLLQWEKTYCGEIQLGRATTTYDGEGEDRDPRGEVPELDRETLDRLEARFTGEIQQVPPLYSAKKIAGRKLYELARNGETVTLEAKTVTVQRLSLEAKSPEILSVVATTSTGFYVRSLAHDIGVDLGCGGYLHHLHRETIGPYTADGALEQEALQAADGPEVITSGDSWVPLENIALPFPDIDLNSSAAERFIHGQDVVVFKPGIEGLQTDAKVVVRGAGNRLLGIGSVRAVLARGRTINIAPSMVFETAAALKSRTPLDTAPRRTRDETR
jgi:tRNA pseudouridine55 synthase